MKIPSIVSVTMLTTTLSGCATNYHEDVQVQIDTTRLNACSGLSSETISYLPNNTGFKFEPLPDGTELSGKDHQFDQNILKVINVFSKCMKYNELIEEVIVNHLDIGYFENLGKVEVNLAILDSMKKLLEVLDNSEQDKFINLLRLLKLEKYIELLVSKT